jgi:CheY-like chemotaxis protein
VLRTRILIVGSPWLARVIVHLFRGRAEFEVIGAASSLESLGKLEGRLLPALIVANVKPLSMGIRRMVRSIKQSSPSSQLILTCPVGDFVRVARKSGADAYLNDEKLAGQLVPVARVLSDRLRTASARE